MRATPAAPLPRLPVPMAGDLRYSTPRALGGSNRSGAHDAAALDGGLTGEQSDRSGAATGRLRALGIGRYSTPCQSGRWSIPQTVCT